MKSRRMWYNEWITMERIYNKCASASGEQHVGIIRDLIIDPHIIIIEYHGAYLISRSM